MVASPRALAFLNLGTFELIVILVIVLLLFGAKRLPDLARGLGKSIQEFKKASKEAENDIRQSIEEQPKTPPPANKTSGTQPPPAANN
jgi:sec-independent protein translocase protein TatA